MANILSALNKTNGLAAQIGSIQQAATGKAATDTAAPAKSTLGAQAVEEQGTANIQAMAGQRQVSALQQAREYGGIEADAAERKATFDQKKASADQDAEYKMQSLIRRYSENWNALGEDRRATMMSTVVTLDNVRNEEKAQKIALEARKRNLDDANKFAAAQATARYAEFIDLAKTSSVISNYIYKNDLQAKEALARIDGADAIAIAMSGLESARIQSTYNDMAKGVEKSLPEAIDYLTKDKPSTDNKFTTGAKV